MIEWIECEITKTEIKNSLIIQFTAQGYRRRRLSTKNLKSCMNSSLILVYSLSSALDHPSRLTDLSPIPHPPGSPDLSHNHFRGIATIPPRSEERRVGKERRSRRASYH